MFKTFEEKAKTIISSLKENFNQIDLLNLAAQDDLENAVNDEISNDINFNSQIENTIDNDIGNEITDDNVLSDNGNDQILPNNTVIPYELPPNFRIYWKAWKEGNNSSGQTESNLETAQMARAEAMTKLYDLGFNDIEILAIETVKNNNSAI